MTIPTPRVLDALSVAHELQPAPAAHSAEVCHAEQPVLTEKENYQRLIGYLRQEDEVQRRLEETGNCGVHTSIKHFQLLNGETYRVPAEHVTREHLQQLGIYFQIVPHDHLKDCWIVDGLPTVDLGAGGTRLLPASCRIVFDDGSAGFDVRVPLFPAPTIYAHAPEVDGRMLIAMALTARQADTRWADSQLHSDDYLISYRVRQLIPAEERIADLLVTLRVNACNQLLECIVVDRPTSVRKASARFTPSAMAASMLAAAAVASQSSGTSGAPMSTQTGAQTSAQTGAQTSAQTGDVAQKLIDKGILRPASADFADVAVAGRQTFEPKRTDDMRPEPVRCDMARTRVVLCRRVHRQGVARADVEYCNCADSFCIQAADDGDTPDLPLNAD
jgi:hypothetical protein